MKPEELPALMQKWADEPEIITQIASELAKAAPFQIAAYVGWLCQTHGFVCAKKLAAELQKIEVS